MLLQIGKRHVTPALENVKGTLTEYRYKDDQPVKQRYPRMQGEINAKVDELLEKG